MKTKARRKKDMILGNLSPQRVIWWAIEPELHEAPMLGKLLRVSPYREDLLDLALSDCTIHKTTAKILHDCVRMKWIEVPSTDPKKIQLPYLTLVEEEEEC